MKRTRSLVISTLSSIILMFGSLGRYFGPSRALRRISQSGSCKRKRTSRDAAYECNDR